MPGEMDHRDGLIEAALALSSELPLPVVLEKIIELATEITQVGYGALGVIGPGGEIAQFITTGVTPEEHRAIGDLPVGRGILGFLIEDARPLRLRNLSEHPRSVGFPKNHPPMHSFLVHRHLERLTVHATQELSGSRSRSQVRMPLVSGCWPRQMES
jgi:two-component system sensor histidine kinase DevS